MEKTLIALSGTIVGFLLGWIKEIIQSRPKLKISLKEGNLEYYKQEKNSFGQVIEEKTISEEANKFVLNLKFDIFNVGKIGDGITDILICISDNNEKLYFQPFLVLPYENKKLENVSFNVESNKVYTVQSDLVLENTEENYYVFGNVNLKPYCKDSLKVTIIAKSIKNKEVVCPVEPISIFTA
ncbi:hypothetical protein SAMN05216497_1357 [Clostridium cochlearium]|uniref:Uncharacterized protein n=1 Tax=Clostridium cochlearium TaxID=1494 RepID=A0ABY0QPF6_CLOCO|nr:hypothetical protein [Clostridium cochlearium]SDL43787.1 hypothetical protein SAMN05216497_1357 [Clostridium cochlearium]